MAEEFLRRVDKSIPSEKPMDKPLLHKRILLFVAAAYTVGLVLGGLLELPVFLYFLIAAPFLLSAVFLRRKRLIAGVLLLIMCLFIGMGMMSMALTPKYADVDLLHPVTMQGKVQSRTLKDGYASYLLSDIQIDGEPIKENVILSSQNMTYVADDIVLAQASLRIPESANYPGGFDDFKYCKSKGVLFRASSHSDAAIGKATGVMAIINSLRRSINDQIEKVFPEQAPLVKALVIGEEEDVDPVTADVFGLAGITHVLAISGSHVLLMCGIVGWLVKKCKLSHNWWFGIEQIFLLFYLLLTGLQISMIRAALMYELILLSRYFGKKRDILTSLAVAYLLITVFYPAQIYDLGLQLSFGAVFSLICLSPKIERLFKTPIKTLSQTVSATLSVTIGLMPILINVNHSFWPLGILINMVATLYSVVLIPALSLFVGVSFLIPISFIGVVGDFLAMALVFVAEVGLPLVKYSLYLPEFAFYWVLLWFVVLFLLSDYVFISARAKTISGLMVVAVYVCSILLPAQTAKEQIRITVVDTGGLSVILHTETNQDILLDMSGTSYLMDYVLSNNLYFEEVHFWEHSTEGDANIKQLQLMKRYYKLYASDSYAKVLQNKYGILRYDGYSDERVVLSPRCWLLPIAEPSAPSGEIVGFRVMVDEQMVCTLTNRYVDALIEDRVPLLIYEDAYNTDILQQDGCLLAVYREQQWGSMAQYQQLTGSTVLNTYETGIVEIVLQKDKTLLVETMYESN